MNLLPTGTKVVIRANARGHNGTVFSSTSETLTQIKGYTGRSDYPYLIKESSQGWNESAFSIIQKSEQPLQDIEHLQVFESLYTEHFGHILRLPTGYVFSKPVTFVPTNTNTL